MLQRVKINSPTEPERRDLIFRDRPVEQDGNRLVGYTAKFNDEIELMEWGGTIFREVIAPGAFTRTLKRTSTDRPIVALHNHNWDIVLGSTDCGSKPPTLRLFEDGIGLGFEVDLPDSEWGRYAREAVDRGDIRGCSFGFWVIDDDPPAKNNGFLRTLKDVELLEITPTCTLPAYTSTEVSNRSHRSASLPSLPRLALAKARQRQFLLNGLFLESQP
jgi:HK97 family phage prohead protease